MIATRLLEEQGVACVPGEVFGVSSNNHVRFCLNQELDVLREAALKIVKGIDSICSGS